VIDYAFNLMRDEISQAIKNMPESTFEISFFRIKDVENKEVPKNENDDEASKSDT
jgi:hypothetical protein